MEKNINEFAVHMEIERNLSSHTVKSYVTDLKQFRLYLQSIVKSSEADDHITINQPDQISIRDYIRYLHRRKLKKITITRKLAAIRSFFNYLLRAGSIEANPAEFVRAPSPEKHIPTFLSVDEMLTVLTIEFKDDIAGLREKALMELFYSAG